MRRKVMQWFGPHVDSVQSITDQLFLALVRIPSPPDAVNQDLHHRRSAVIDHFRARVRCDWLAPSFVLTDLRLDLGRLSTDELVGAADRAVQGDFHPSGVRPVMTKDGRLDWSTNPAGKREWLLMLHRHSWWALWAVAYDRTGDERYARAFVMQLTDWIAAHPLPRQKSEDYEPWRLMEAGLRLRISWIPCFAAFYDSPHFDDQVKWAMLRAIYDHGRFLNRFFTNRNHLVRESNGLVALALIFPEFLESGEWLKNALQRLDAELQTQVNADGSHIEMSVGYQWLTVDEFEVTQKLLEQHNQRLPTTDIDSALRGMYSFLAAVMRPDRTFPQINDGFILWDADRLENAARMNGWGDVEYAASGGQTGTTPVWCSRNFPNAGVHVMRSEWGPSAHYLIADTGPYGGPHGHEDLLSFELSAAGVPIIVDPGSYTYAADDPFRNYFVGSSGHNTMLVDHKSQVRRWRAEHTTPSSSRKNYGHWQSNEHADYAGGIHAGDYATFSILKPQRPDIVTGVTHQREFLFVKPDYWVIVDSVVTAEERCFQFLFHFAPDIIIDTPGAGDAIARCPKSNAGLVLMQLGGPPMRRSVICGADAPIQGWFSHDHHKKCPSPAVELCTTGTRSFSVAWLLFPLRNCGEAATIVKSISLSSTRGGQQIQVNRQDDQDCISIGVASSLESVGAVFRPSSIRLERNGQVVFASTAEQ